MKNGRNHVPDGTSIVETEGVFTESLDLAKEYAEGNLNFGDCHLLDDFWVDAFGHVRV